MALKKKYPNYYLWNCSLFKTDLYKEFEAQVLTVIEKEESIFSSSQLMERAMPELIAALGASFGSLNASIQLLASKQAGEMEKLSKKFTNFFALGSVVFGQGNPTASMIESPNDVVSFSSVAEGEHGEQQPKTKMPAYILNRTIMTVTDVWREYKDGLGGNPSVEFMEKEYGTAWRKDRKESRFFSRRKELYGAIKNKAVAERTSCEEAARRIEERRVCLGISLDKLRSVLKDDVNSSPVI